MAYNELFWHIEKHRKPRLFVSFYVSFFVKCRIGERRLKRVGKAPSDAIAGFLARPARFFQVIRGARKITPEGVPNSCVMRYFVAGFVMCCFRKNCRIIDDPMLI